MRKMAKIVIILFGAISIILFWYLKVYLIRHPITMMHPVPTLTKNLPILKKLDRFICLTGGITWYMVKEKATGKEYLFFYEVYNGKLYLYVMDNKKRHKFERLSRKEFLKRFEQPVYGDAIK